MKGLVLTVIFGLIIFAVCVKAYVGIGMPRYDPLLPIENHGVSGCSLENLYSKKNRSKLTDLWHRENLNDANYLYLEEKIVVHNYQDYWFTVIAIYDDYVIKSEYAVGRNKPVETDYYSRVEAQNMFDSLKLKPGETRESGENTGPSHAHPPCEFRKYMRAEA